MKYKADSIITNHFFNIAMQVLGIICPLIAIPYTTRLFGPEIIGKVNYINSIVQYFILIASAGIPIYATREIARVRDNPNELRKNFYQISVVQILCTVISIILYIILVSVVDKTKSDTIIYIFLGLQILSNSFNMSWFMQGIEKYRYVAISNFIGRLLNVILIFVILKTKTDYIKYSFIIGITTVIINLINLIVSIKMLSLFKSDEKVNINLKSVNAHFSVLAIFFLTDVAAKIYTSLDQTMLGILSTTESVGYYSMSIRLVKAILAFITSIGIIIMPRIANSIKNNKMEDIKKYAKLSVKLVCILAIPAIFGILAIAEEIVLLYLGSEFLQSIVIFKAVSILLLLIGLSNVFGIQLMIPYQREKKYTVILAICALINFLINLILIPKYSYFGAAYATIISELVVVILTYRESKKLIGNIIDISSIIKYVIPSVVFYLVIKYVIKSFVTKPILIIVYSIPVAGIIYLVGLIVFKEDIVMYGMKKVKQVLKKIKQHKK